MENKNITPILLAFIAGALVGKEWPKIEKFLKPYLKNMEPLLKDLGKSSSEGYSTLITSLAQQKEKLEDMIAESKIKKRKEEGVIAKKVIKKRKKKRKPKKKEKKTTIVEETKEKKLQTLNSLKNKAGQVIEQHPEGITLQKMAEEIGAHFVRLSRPVKELLGKNKIRKEGKLYFPIS